MVEINLENKTVDFVIDVISTVVGLASASLVGALFGPTIAAQTGFKKLIFTLGRAGIETIVAYDVSSVMKEEITDCVESYNKTASEINAGRQIISESEIVTE